MTRGGLLAVAIGLAGALGVSLYLHAVAAQDLERHFDERLRAAGGSAAIFAAEVSPEQLAALEKSNGLEAAFVVDRELQLVADAKGTAPGPVDLLRVDQDALQAALEGRATVSLGYHLGELPVASGYFPFGSRALVLEAGQAFAAERQHLARARWVAIGLSLLAAAGLFAVGRRQAKLEAQRRADAEKLGQAEGLSRMAAMAAHEIRNPLGIIRGTIELLLEKPLEPAVQSRLREVIEEVARLNRLTEDFVDLSQDRPVHSGPIELAALIEDVAQASQQRFPSLKIDSRQLEPSLVAQGDPGRMRQVLLNLFTNAAQARPDVTVTVEGRAAGEKVVLRFSDDGPGVPAELRSRLFQPFTTGKAGGMGLGLSVSRRLIERQQGRLSLLEVPSGAAFEVELRKGN